MMPTSQITRNKNVEGSRQGIVYPEIHIRYCGKTKRGSDG
jgi:hypothetical protein